MKEIQKQKGITLIALVITIIVLIILAGVGINLTLGENGILRRAENAREMSDKATVKEKIEVAIVEVQVEEATSTGRLTIQKLYEILESKDSNITLNEFTEGDTELTGTYNLNGKIYNFTIDSEFKVIIGDGEESTPEGEEPAAVTVKFGEITWESGKASITLSSDSEGTIEYQVNGQTEGSWTEGTTVGNLNHEDTVYARINDGTTTTEPQQKQIKDTTLPEEFTISVPEDSITYEELKITTTGTTDNQTGLKDYSYVVTKDGAVVQEIKNQTVTEYPIEELAAETEYVVYMLAYDNAENVRKSNEVTVTTEAMPVARMFGQYVDYPVDIDDNPNDYDWQIFYIEDGTNNPDYEGATYIIPDYYVPASKMTTSISNTGMTKYSSGTYGLKCLGSTYKTITNEVRSIFMYDYTGTSNGNVKAVSRFLDTTAWKNDFVISQLQTKGGMAIGGPTINMWCASWNKAYPTEKIIATISGTGYQVNGSASLRLNSYSGYKTDAPNVYFPTKNDIDDRTNTRYWIASPGWHETSGDARVLGMDYEGDISGYAYSAYLFVRPVVYLPSTITITPSGTANLWNINY